MIRKPHAYCLALFFTGLLCLFSCQEGNGNKKEIIKTMSPFPTDHKLTSQERKEFSNKFLVAKHVPVLEHLPLTDDHTTASFRDEKEVAGKTVVLYGLIYVAHNEKTSEEMIAYFKKYGLWKFVSPEERQFLEKKNKTAEDNIPVTWRMENMNVLLWALGHFDTLAFPTTICDFSNYKNLPDLEEDPNDWISRSRLRNKEEILNETDLIYRIHWATTEARLKGKPMPAGLNDDIVMERHFALNWLTMYAENWDDITTDT